MIHRNEDTTLCGVNRASTVPENRAVVFELGSYHVGEIVCAPEVDTSWYPNRSNFPKLRYPHRRYRPFIRVQYSELNSGYVRGCRFSLGSPGCIPGLCLPTPGMTFWSSTWLLTLKSCRLIWRHPGSLLVILFSPVAAMMILFLLQRSFDRGEIALKSALRNAEPQTFSLGHIPRCIPSAFPDCITLAYVPSDNKQVKDWVESVARMSNIPVDNETKGFADSATLNAFLVANPNRTQAAYVFEQYNFDEIARKTVSFIVQYNTSRQKVFADSDSRFNTDVVVPAMLTLMNSAIRTSIAPANINIDITASIFPHPLLSTGENTFIHFGPFLMLGIFFLVIVTFVSKMTEEKELGIREAMRLAGMTQAQHFLSWGLPMFSLLATVTMLLIAFGHAFRLPFFTNTSFSVYFLTLFIFALALLCWAFLLSAFLQTTRTVSHATFLLFLLKIIIGTASAVVYITTPDGEPFIAKQSLYWRGIFAMLPSTLFVRSVIAIAVAASRNISISLKQAASYPTSYSIRTCWFCMLGSGAVALFFAVYFDNVLPTHHGSAQSPFYLFSLSYWGLAKPNSTKTNITPRQSDCDESECTSQEDSSVSLERERISRGECDSDPLVVKNLFRLYNKFTAVNGVSLSVPRNTAFVCLGHNGAGKSSLFNMLSTSLRISHGDVFICGRSIRDFPGKARRILGVCQQHDALWDDLSPAEHIELFAALKGMKASARRSEASDRIADAGLEKQANRPARALSGGMRRRLSVAISLAGNPQVLLLDEFTTGADPLIMRAMWGVVERAKKDRVVFIITHCTAEAERLGDKIGIMCEGKLRVMGTSLNLKKRFGCGYHVHARMPSSTTETLEEELRKICPGLSTVAVKPIQEGEVVVEYTLPPSLPESTVKNVTYFLESQREQLSIVDFSLNSSSLDEVFKIVSESTDIKKRFV